MIWNRVYFAHAQYAAAPRFSLRAVSRHVSALNTRGVLSLYARQTTFRNDVISLSQRCFWHVIRYFRRVSAVFTAWVLSDDSMSDLALPICVAAKARIVCH